MLRVLALASAAVFAAALARFAGAHPAIEVAFPRGAKASAARRNLARFDEGVIVRASSADWHNRHHPGYAVDGAERPSLIEKWASDPRDRAPWIEVQLGAPRAIDEVALELAGAHESAALTERRYRIDCFAGAARVFSAELDNAQPRPRHAVQCAGADRVRITFTPRDAVRLYEVELWGR